MGDMAEDFKALKDFNKKIKDKRSIEVITYLKELQSKELIDLDTLNSIQGHYRVYIDDLRIDVWASTCKFTIVGSNKYNQGLNLLRSLIKSRI